MTTYILHGGKTSKECPRNDTFYSEFTKGQKDTVHILLCYWARDKVKWTALAERDKHKVIQHAGDKNVVFETAENVDDFLTKIKNTDVVYIAGGTYQMLYEEIAKVHHVEDLMANKLVIGSSAGSFLLCNYSLNSFDYQPADINKGLALIPANVLCHWDIETKKIEKINKIKAYDHTSPIFLIDEADYLKVTI